MSEDVPLSASLGRLATLSVFVAYFIVGTVSFLVASELSEAGMSLECVE